MAQDHDRRVLNKANVIWSKYIFLTTHGRIYCREETEDNSKDPTKGENTRHRWDSQHYHFSHCAGSGLKLHCPLFSVPTILTRPQGDVALFTYHNTVWFSERNPQASCTSGFFHLSKKKEIILEMASFIPELLDGQKRNLELKNREAVN